MISRAVIGLCVFLSVVPFGDEGVDARVPSARGPADTQNKWCLRPVWPEVALKAVSCFCHRTGHYSRPFCCSKSPQGKDRMILNYSVFHPALYSLRNAWLSLPGHFGRALHPDQHTNNPHFPGLRARAPPWKPCLLPGPQSEGCVDSRPASCAGGNAKAFLLGQAKGSSCLCGKTLILVKFSPVLSLKEGLVVIFLSAVVHPRAGADAHVQEAVLRGREIKWLALDDGGHTAFHWTCDFSLCRLHKSRSRKPAPLKDWASVARRGPEKA